MAEWPCCHDPLRFSPLSLRFVPPLHRDPSCTIILPRRFCSTHFWRAGIFPKCPETPTPKERIVRHASVRPFEHVGAWGTLGHRRGHVAGAWPTSRTRRCTCRVPAARAASPLPLPCTRLHSCSAPPPTVSLPRSMLEDFSALKIYLVPLIIEMFRLSS